MHRHPRPSWNPTWQFHGFGLDSSEVDGRPPSKFQRCLPKSARAVLPVVAHAGEEGPPNASSVLLDIPQQVRPSSITASAPINDPALVSTPRPRAQMPLTVCPLSNVKLSSAVPSMRASRSRS